MIVHRRAVLPPEASTDRIVARLHGVRRGIHTRTLIAGLAKTLWTLLLFAAIDLVLDRFLRLDVSQRGIMLAIVLSVTALLVYRWLYRPFRESVSDDALALAIEAANPRLRQSLITALQLSRPPDLASGGVSRELRRQAIATGCKAADEISFRDILDTRHTSRNGGLLGAAILCLVGCLIALPFSPLLRTWFSRNVLLSRATWPQQTNLIIEHVTDTGTVVFPRGGDWTQVVEVGENSRVVPNAVYLELREPARGKQRTSLLMERLGERRFESEFHDVRQPFEFRARGGDAVTDWVRVELVDPPELRDLAIKTVPPKYSGVAAQSLVPGQSAYQVLHGSSLHLEAVASKPLAAADIVRDGQRWKLELKNEPESPRLSGQIPATELADGAYALELTDSLGLSSRVASFSLRWQSDHEPRVTAQLQGIGNLILPQARLPLHCRTSDDFGVSSIDATLEYTANKSETEPNKKVISIASQGELTTVGEPTDRREFDVGHILDLEPLMLSAGTNLRLQVEAADNNDVTGPGVGRSADLFLRVTDEAEFRTDLLHREKAERQELERLWKLQDDLLTESRARAAEIRDPEATKNDRGEKLLEIYRGQKQIGQKLTALAQRITEMASEIVNNRLPDPGASLQNRLLLKIADPLRELAAGKVVSVTQMLDRARRAERPIRNSVLAQAVTAQAEIASGMKLVLEQMLTSEGYQEAIDLLYEIQRAQGDILDQTNKAKEAQIRRILEGKN